MHLIVIDFTLSEFLIECSLCARFLLPMLYISSCIKQPFLTWNKLQVQIKLESHNHSHNHDSLNPVTMQHSIPWYWKKVHCPYLLLLIVTLACAPYPGPECSGGLSAVVCMQVMMQTSSRNIVRQRSVLHGSAPEALPFKCIACNSNFTSWSAADSHSRHWVAQGTPCADPKSLKSQSITAQIDLSTGILRLHDAGPICEITCTRALAIE